MKSPTPMRAYGIALAVPQFVIGVWAVLSPRGWYDNFPGIGPALAAAEPPYNAHLITDAGAGFLTTGGLLLGACLLGGAAEMRLAAAGYLLFTTPHLVYHALNPSPLLDAANDVLNAVLIGAQVTGAVTLLAFTTDGRNKHGHPEADMGLPEGHAEGATQPG